MKPETKLAFAFITSAALVGTALASPVSQGGRKFTTELTGAAEAPGPGDPDGSGTANITLNHGQGRICYEISLSLVDGVTAAHIHEAPVGTPGPVVVGLFTDGFDPQHCVSADRDVIKDIIQNPQDYYVNVHSTAHSAGAVRGQLSK